MTGRSSPRRSMAGRWRHRNRCGSRHRTAEPRLAAGAEVDGGVVKTGRDGCDGGERRQHCEAALRPGQQELAAGDKTLAIPEQLVAGVAAELVELLDDERF